MALIEMQKLSRIYHRGDSPINALLGVSLKVESGEMAVIMGPSGSGKTTLLHIVGLLDRSYDGNLKIDGKSVDNLNELELARLRLDRIGFVFQSFNLLGGLTVRDNVALPNWYLHKKRSTALRKADALLNELGLRERINHYPAQLSAGEQQRVAVARALINEPKIIIADEPAAHLDEDATLQMAKLLSSLTNRGSTVVVATHDKALTDSADQIYYLRFGEIVDQCMVPSNIGEHYEKVQKWH